MHKTIVIPDEMVPRIVAYGRKHHESKLIYGVTWSAVLRQLIQIGLEQSEKEEEHDR